MKCIGSIITIIWGIGYFFTAVRELNFGGNRVTIVSFSLVISIGLYLVMLLYDYSRLLLKEKEAAEHEQMVLMYEVRSAKREMQASADIRRLYHDVKNHLLAIQSTTFAHSGISDLMLMQESCSQRTLQEERTRHSGGCCSGPSQTCREWKQGRSQSTS